jgi:hypothetical protein
MQQMLHTSQNRRILEKMRRLIWLLNLIKGKTMRQTIRVSLLVFALTCTARAGDIPNMIIDPPPPTNAQAAGDIPYPVTSQPTSGEMQNGQTTQVTAMTVAVELVRVVLSLA